MKLNLFLYSIATLVLSSCGDGGDTYKCYQSVVEKAGPGAEVRQLPKTKYEWLAKKADGSVWYYITGDLDEAVVTSEEKMW